MSKIRAIVQEIDDGAFYNVLLQAIPRVGEQIDLFSNVDVRDKQKSNHIFKVESISHKIHDVPEDVSDLPEGHHEVTIYVSISNEEPRSNQIN
jgi:hypothetical protein